MNLAIEILKRDIKEKQNELARLEVLAAEKPLVIGQTYTTKLQTAEKFTLTRILTNKNGQVTGLKGVWTNCSHLGEVPLGADRLLSKTGTFNL